MVAVKWSDVSGDGMVTTKQHHRGNSVHSIAKKRRPGCLVRPYCHISIRSIASVNLLEIGYH